MSAPLVIVAPDKFKGSLTASEAGIAIASGFHSVWAGRYSVSVLPNADGGEGTLEAFLAFGAEPVQVPAHGPWGDPLTASYALFGSTAIIEMASASGLAHARRGDARTATTYGTGELLRAALDAGATRIVLGIGGSATTDGGAGALAALGVRFLDRVGGELAPDPTALAGLAAIDASGLDPRLRETPIQIACDVDNPLLGERGAAAVYGPQKGAKPDDVAFLDATLTTLANCIARATGVDHREMPGSGAAGGLGFGLAAFTNARLTRGFDIVAEVTGLAQSIDRAVLVCTGEGRIDSQSLRGKVVAGTSDLALAAGVPCVAFAGSIERDAERAFAERGTVCLPIVTGPMTIDVAVRDAEVLLTAAAARFARCWGAPAAEI